MNLIRIAGHVVNMDNVLYVEYGDSPGEAHGPFVRFCFAAPVHSEMNNQVSNHPSWRVTGADAAMFILWLEKNSTDVIPTEPGISAGTERGRQGVRKALES